MAKPQVMNQTSLVEISTGSGAGQFRAWPADHGVGWAVVVECKSHNEVVATPAGYTLLAANGTGPAGGPASTRVTVFLRLADAAVMAANGGKMPDVVILNPGSGVLWAATFLKDVHLTIPVPVASTTNVQTPASTSVSAPTIDTTGFADCLIFNVFTHAVKTVNPLYGAWVNASLTNRLEHMDRSSTAGPGGGLAIVTGEKAAGGVVAATTTSLASSSVQARATVAIQGAAVAGALPASTHLCGGECGNVGHFDTRYGTLPTIQSSIAKDSPHALSFDPVDAISAVGWNISSTKEVIGGDFRLKSFPPNDVILCRFAVDPAGFSPEIRYRSATKDIVAGSGTFVTSPLPAVLGRFYHVSKGADVSVDPRTVALTIDGVSLGVASKATPPGLFTEVIFGASIEEPTTYGIVWDNVKIGPDLTLYPFPPRSVVGLDLVSDGVHGFNADGDFKRGDGANLLPSATDLFTNLLGLLTNPTLRLMSGTASAGEYVAVKPGGMPAAVSVAAFEVLALLLTNAAGVNKQSLRMFEGATGVDVYLDQDSGGGIARLVRKHFTKSPTNAALAQALFNGGLELRWGPGLATIDTTPPIGLAGIRLEVEYEPTAPPPGQPGSQEQNPEHLFGAPGTYQVRLDVLDNRGAIGTVTIPTVVTS